MSSSQFDIDIKYRLLGNYRTIIALKDIDACDIVNAKPIGLSEKELKKTQSNRREVFIYVRMFLVNTTEGNFARECPYASGRLRFYGFNTKPPVDSARGDFIISFRLHDAVDPEGLYVSMFIRREIRYGVEV